MRKKTTAELIKQFALQILESEGPEHVTMRRVAKAVGITPMAIYHYFRRREDLLSTITDAEFEKLAEFFKTRKAARSPWLRVIAILEGYVDYALAHPRLFDYMFSKPRTDARRFPTDFRQHRSPTANLLAEAVADGMHSGELSKDDVYEVTAALGTYIHGFVALYLAGRSDLSEAEFRALCRRSIMRLFNGLKA